ncbi:hypothetical protein FRC03_009514 [Tulasnella sp. 419]|nr:hypothetical protein FRC02_009150 [Tulasnella sp. 418]KAG8967677.1 hypothetical protein FRC03_009514 [Tulasnella sp. 419]
MRSFLTFIPLIMLSQILLLTLYATGALTAPANRPARICGNHRTEEQIALTESRLANIPSRLPDLSGPQTVENITVPVYWHVLTSGSTPAQGNISNKQIVDSIDVMNERYAPTGFVFQLIATDRTRNATWFNQIFFDTPVEQDAKGALYRGGANTLNVYTASFTDVPDERFIGTLGYSTWPSDYVDKPRMDGVVIQYKTLPGGSLSPYNLGMTLVHEVGHWFGLYHTFEGGCRGVGDMVADTPPQRYQTSGCPTSRDTCLNGGKDPIHNYMDYSDDDCMTEFTPGQISRMKTFYSTFRAI